MDAAAGACSFSFAAGEIADASVSASDQVPVATKVSCRDLRVCTAKERISRMPPCTAGKRSSIYRGVTRHRWTGRYEAHLWDKSTWNQNQNKKGKQVYLGAYDDEEAAARAYDLAALKYWGAGTLINFPVGDYSRDLEEMQMISKEEYLVSLRRKSSAFSRGFPKYRGVSRQPQNSRCEAGYMLGNVYFNNIASSTSTDTTIEDRCAGSFCMDRKIDLTPNIRWWTSKKTLNPESTHRELQYLECSMKPTEPYRLPSLGLPHKWKAEAHGLSACAMISKSASFKSFQDKFERTEDESNSKMEEGKAVPGSISGTELIGSQVNSRLTGVPDDRIHYMHASQISTSWSHVGPSDSPYWTAFNQPTENFQRR